MEKVFEVFELKSTVTPSSILTAIELRDYIDFKIKRLYYITTPKTDSGQHCHFIEKELFILIQGSCTAVIDRGQGKENILLNPGKAIYVANYVWHGFKDFTKDTILLAASSTNYKPDRSDYLQDYEKYLQIRDKHLKKKSFFS